MSKEEMMSFIEEINTQLKKNKEIVNAYAGQEVSGDSGIITLCELSKCLISTKKTLKETLLFEYGIYYMG